MVLFKKLNILLITAAFFLSFAVSSADGQRGRYWRGDNGRHNGWSQRRGWKKHKRYRHVTYRPYYRGYRYRPDYVVYRAYPRYYTYPRYRYYPRYRRGSSVNINFRF